MRKISLFLSLFTAISLFAQSEGQYLSFTEGYVDARNFQVSKQVTETKSYIDVTYTFEGAKLTTTKGGTLIEMDHSISMTPVGEPSLPSYMDLFIVPTIDNVKIEELKVEYKDFEEIEVAPSAGIASLSGKDSKNGMVRGEVYQLNQFYPAEMASIVESKIYQGAPLVSVSLSPIRVNPVTKTLRCYSSVTYRIHINANYVTSVDATTLEKIKGVIANTEGLSRYSAPLPQDAPGRPISYSEPDKYIFITVPEYVKAVKEFAEWKTMMGYECVIMSNAKWTTKSVRDSIVNYSKNKADIKYVLIVGNSNQIPNKTVNLHFPKQGEVTIPTDKLYACLSDTTQGITDFTIARITGDSEAVIKGTFDKIKRYESTPPRSDSFYKKGLHCAYFQDTYEEDSVPDGRETPSYSFVQVSEQIHDLNVARGKEITRIYSRQYRNPAPAFLNNGNAVSSALLNDSVWMDNKYWLKNNIEQGQSYILFSGHGSSAGWSNPTFSDSDVRNLNNGELLPVVISSACHVGNFNDETCLAKAFLENPNGGAVAMTANTHYGWSNVMDCYATNVINLLMMAGVPYSVADAMEVSLVSIGCNITDYIYHTRLAHHYFGDPSMKMYSYVPECISPQITQNNDTVWVQTNLSNCQITLTSRENPLDMSKFKTFANKSSVKFVNVDYPYSICITKSGYVPYISLPDKYEQNVTFTADTTLINGFNIYAGKNVTSNVSKGDVVCRSGRTELKATGSIFLRDGFRVAKGAEFRAVPMENESCSYKAYQYDIFGGDMNIAPSETPSVTEIKDEDAVHSTIHLYPNPTDGQFTVDFGVELGVKVVSVFSMNGELLLNSQTSEGNIEFNFSEMKSGIYVIRIVTDNKVETKRLIKR